MARAIDYLVAHRTEAEDLSLEKLAGLFGYDPSYFQKLFKSHIGVSPKQFCRYMHYTRARDLLVSGMPTLEAAFEAGLSGQGRLHDLFLRIEAMTPGQVAKRGRGVVIHYGFAPSILGELMIGKTDRGICWLGFQVDESQDLSMARMRDYWPMADFVESDVTEVARAISQIWAGETADRRLVLDLYGTDMQLQVWQALLRIPFGHVVDYKTIAAAIDKPKAARAVGNAVGMNPVSLLIPCHRVIQASGIVNNYGWGSPRKKTLLGMEGYLTT